jgi:signal transduction histidine kinase
MVSRAPPTFALRRVLTLGGFALLGMLAAAATALGLGGTVADDPAVMPALRGLVVASYVAVGTYTWWRRPASNLGLFVTEIGLVYAVVALSVSTDALAHTVGRATLAGFVVCLVYVFLCFPHDRIDAARDRRLVATLALATAAAWLPLLLLAERLPAGGPLSDCGASCPDNAFRLAAVPDGLSTALGSAANAVTAVGLVAAIAVFVGRALSPARLRQRLILPLLFCFMLLAGAYALFTMLRQAGVDDGLAGLKVIGAASALAIPAAMLVGQVRGRVFAATRLGQLVARLDGHPVTAERLEALLRDALGDPALRLALREPGAGYVDVEGRPIELPTDRRDVAVTPVVRHGRLVAALIHDPALEEAAEIAEGLAATAFVLLENARLVNELRSSRARIVASAQRERLRLERNLHDGAQQRLFTQQLKVERLRRRVGDDGLARDLDEIAEETAAALDELRALAHGLYPTVLRDLGLADALKSLARTAAVPVKVVDRGVGRWPEGVEEAVYFCVLEAVQNAARHAGPDARITVELERRGSDLAFAVTDDGKGFEPVEHADGMGLVNMEDRVGAVGGELEITSTPGGGTTVRGSVPATRRFIRPGR